MFRWQETFEEVPHSDEEVKVLNEVLLNICSNFMSTKLKKIKAHQVHWITPSIRSFLGKKNHALKSFVKKGQPEDMLEGIQNMIAQGSKLVKDAKHKYFTKVGRTLSDLSTGTKKYWCLINKILNKAKIPEIPPLLENDIQQYTSKCSSALQCITVQCIHL